MPDSNSLLRFVAAALVVLLIPGPGVMYVVARSVSQGRRAGLVSVLGLSAGALVHVAAAAAGISALLLASATAFGMIRILGAGYLIYLGVRTLFARQVTARLPAAAPRSLRRLFAQGVMVSILNPKVAVFFLAFLPQFVEPSRGSVPRQVLMLGLIYIALALSTDSAYATLAGSISQWLRGRVMQGPLPRYLSGGIYLGLGVGTALTGRRH
ncbi:MAG TPA: LysE family translocator [Steroidobacteraceae bacterium]|jgi:threonine/homoserine/homoserine lactone efflux protein